MRYIILSVQAAAIILVAVCLLLPAIQWAMIPTDTIARVLTGLTALAFGVCKIVFFPIAKFHFNGGNILSSGAFLLCGLLFLSISVNSTYLFLNSQLNERITLVKQQSDGFKNRLKQVETIDTQLKTLQSLIDSDLKNGFRSRAYNNMDKIDRLKAEREALFQDPIEQPIKTNLSYLTIGTLSSALVVAIVLHLACIMAVMACTGWQPAIDAHNKNALSQSKKPESEIKPIQPIVTIKEEANMLTDEQEKLAQQIAKGVYGDKPKMKQLIEQKAIKGGFKKIKPVFETLISRNVMRRNGQQYELIQKTI